MKKGLRLVLLGLLAISGAGLLIHAWHPSAKAAGNGALLTGNVKSAQGEKMAGVTVSAKMSGSTITTSVFTDADGNFYFPSLPEGNYRVWAQAVGYDRGLAEVNMTGPVKDQDFTLKTLADFSMQLTSDQWMASLPEETAEDKKMKEVLRLNCEGCHTVAYPLQNRFDEKGWATLIGLMGREGGVTCYVDCAPGGLGEDQPPTPAVNYFKPELAAYLAKVRGPKPYPIKYKLRPRPSGEAALAVITEYDVRMSNGEYNQFDGSDWTFGVPGRAGGVHDAQIDWDGNLYSTDWSPNKARTVVKIDGKTGKQTDIRIPAENGLAAGAHAIMRDENGILWFNCRVGSGFFNNSYGELCRLDPKGGNTKVDVFKPDSNLPPVGDFLDWDTKGNIWVAAGGGETRGGLMRFNEATRKFTYYKSPVGEGTDEGHSGLYGVTADSQGNGYWSLFSANMIGKVEVETGKVSTIKLPAAPDSGVFNAKERKVFQLEGDNAFFWGTPDATAPRRPGGDKHGDAVYFPGWWTHTLIKLDTSTGKITQYPMPIKDAGPYMTQVDKNHVVWIDFQNSGTIAKFDSKTEKWTMFSMPALGLETHEIGVMDHGPRTEVTVADAKNSKIDKLQERTQEEVDQLKAQVRRELASNK